MRGNPDHLGCEDRRAEDDAKRGTGQIRSGRQPGEPGIYRPELVLDDDEIGARLIGLAQRAARVSGHTGYVCPEGVDGPLPLNKPVDEI
jgi:hypothetical protein